MLASGVIRGYLNFLRAMKPSRALLNDEYKSIRNKTMLGALYCMSVSLGPRILVARQASSGEKAFDNEKQKQKTS